MARSDRACILALALALGQAGQPAFASDQAAAAAIAAAPDAKLGIARRIVAIAFPVESREATFNAAMDAMLVQMRATMFTSLKNDSGAEQIVNAQVDRFVARGKAILRGHIPAMMEGLAAAYSREFAASELDELLAFAQTPAGRHFLQRNSAVLSDPDFRAANEAYMRELQPEIGKMQTTLMEELAAYFRNNPPRSSSGS